MTSVVLNKEFDNSRDEVMAQLKKRCIDSRPFFPPISSFPMFNYYDNPIAKYIGANGINLPSAHNLVHEDVKYVCECLKDILQG